MIRKHGDYVAVTVEDNGKGFDVVQKLSGDPKPKETGIAAMHERVRMMGGSLEMFSQENSGTVIIFNIPINRNPAHEILL